MAARRVVSVLFADLAGFTALGEALDAEDLAAVQDAYFARVAAAVEREAGRVEKYIGDAVVAAFGAVRAGDDDAGAAVRAGLAVLDAVADLAAELGLDEALRVRAGVATGEVLVAPSASSDDLRLTGDVVNTASRLQTAASPGTLLLDAATALAAEPAFLLEPAGLLALKGKAEQVPAWRAVAPRATPSREEVLRDLRGPLLGREAELDRLDAAQTSGRPPALLVVAPPGTGKTRLVTAWRARLAARGVAVYAARAEPGAGPDTAPVAELLRAALAEELSAREPAAAVAARLSRGRVASRRGALAAEHVLALVEGRRLDADPADLHTSWLAALDGGAEPEVAWVVEDLHAAGPDLLAFLRRALDGPRRPNRTLVLTSRPGAASGAEGYSLGAVEVLHLEPLPDAAVTGLLAATIGRGVLPGDVAQRVADAAAGNPLYVEELLRTWAQSGLLSRDDRGGWRWTGPASEISIPTTVQSVYLSQLDALHADGRRVVTTGSIPGQAFPAAALPALGVADPAEPLARLTGWGLLQGPEHSGPAAPTYSYRHALLRETAYASLPRRERGRLHLGYARWAETALGEAAGADVVATHLLAALEASPSLPRDDAVPRDALAAEAADWLERAADLAAGREPQRSALLLEKSVELTDSGDGGRLLRRRARLAESLRRAGRLPEALAAFEAAGDLAAGEGNAEAETAAALGYEDALYASRLPRTSYGEAGRRLLVRALSGARGAPDAGALARSARLLAALARAQAYTGEREGALRTAGTAAEQARASGNDAALAYALLAQWTSLDGPQRRTDRLALTAQVQAAARRGGAEELELEGARLELVDRLGAGDMAGVDAAQARCEQLVAALGQPLYLWYPAMWRAMRALLAGSPRAVGLVAAFREEGELWHYRDVDQVHAVQAAQLHLERGEPDEARRVMEPAAETDPLRWAPLLASCHALAGRPDRARSLLARHLDSGFEVLPDDLARPYLAAMSAVALTVLDEPAAADRLAEELTPYAGSLVVVGSGALCLGAASRFLGLALRAAGRVPEAAEAFAAAVQLDEASGAAPAAARSRAELASTLRLLDGSTPEPDPLGGRSRER